MSSLATICMWNRAVSQKTSYLTRMCKIDLLVLSNDCFIWSLKVSGLLLHQWTAVSLLTLCKLSCLSVAELNLKHSAQYCLLFLNGKQPGMQISALTLPQWTFFTLYFIQRHHPDEWNLHLLPLIDYTNASYEFYTCWRLHLLMHMLLIKHGF